MAKEVGSKHYLWAHIQCEHCRTFFDATRQDAKYCTPACRKKAQRQREAEEKKWDQMREVKQWVFEMLRDNKYESLSAEKTLELRGLLNMLKSLVELSEEHREIFG